MAANKELQDSVKRIHDKIRGTHLNNQEIGKRIKSIREQLGLTQKQFEKLVKGYSLDKVANTASGGNSNASKWECGNNLTDVQTLYSIATAGGVSLQWLLFGGSNEKPQKATIKEWTLRDIGRALFEFSKYAPVGYNDGSGTLDGTGYFEIFIPNEYETNQKRVLGKLFSRIAKFPDMVNDVAWSAMSEKLIEAGLSDIPDLTINEMTKADAVELAEIERDQRKGAIKVQTAPRDDDIPF